MKRRNAEKPTRRNGCANGWLCAATLILVANAAALADSITFNGSSIPLRNCRVQSIGGGELVYAGPNGQRQQRSLDDVNALSFDEFALLDQAEELIAAGDLDAGLTRLMQAALAADTELEKVWTRARLARMHDARSQYVESAGHAAVVFAMTDDPYWRKLEPVCEPRPAMFAAVCESLDALENAVKSVRSTALKASAQRMISVITPMRDELAKSYTGQPIAPGSTISGVNRADLVAEPSDPINASTKQPAQPVKPTTTKPKSPPPPPPKPIDAQPAQPQSPPVELEPIKPPTAPSNESKSQAAIESLLEQKQFVEALAQCQKVEANPGDRDLAKFLWQYGRALEGNGKTSDAAVMFTRCGLLYPDSPCAAQCLIAAAIIARDVRLDPAAAGRLLQRAAEVAKRNNQPEFAEQALKALQSLAETSANKEP